MLTLIVDKKPNQLVIFFCIMVTTVDGLVVLLTATVGNHEKAYYMVYE